MLEYNHQPAILTITTDICTKKALTDKKAKGTHQKNGLVKPEMIVVCQISDTGGWIEADHINKNF